MQLYLRQALVGFGQRHHLQGLCMPSLVALTAQKPSYFIEGSVEERSFSFNAAHTQEDLEELYCTQNLDEEAFIYYGNEMLDAVAVFWDG